MDNAPLVSICCETYNHAKYIRQALDGFLSQKTDFSFEILIHDDASTDGTQSIIEEYYTRNPDLFKPIFQTENQHSKGISIWRKYQFPRAKGKYIALCEGDDYWTDPLKLQKQVDFLESHPDYSMCFHNAIVHYESSNKKDHLFSQLETREYNEQELTSAWLGATASFVFRRTVYLSKYFEEYINSTKFIVGDYPLLLCCLRAGKIYALSDCMSVYRINPGGWTQKKHSVYKFIEMERDVYRIFGGMAGVSAKINASKDSREAISLLYRGHLHDGFKIWSSAFRFAPWLTIKENIKFAFKLVSSKFCKS